MKLVILDRDGVVNEDSPNFIKSPREWHPIPGSLEAIARLSQAGWTVSIATNQSGLGRGLLDVATLNAIHRLLEASVARAGGRIDALHYCPHVPADDCQCRKPRPGLLLEIARRFGTSLAGVPAIGDSERDLEAARRAGARPILVLTGSGRDTLAGYAGREPPEHYADLAAAVDHLLAEPR
jgi:D-glycero-D-manno-heptose 1,7-bisphosphate phosphatase